MLEHYYKYRRVIDRFRSGALGNGIDRIAPHFSRAGYKHDSARLYLARIARFSAYAARRGCDKATPISAQIVDQFLRSRGARAAQIGRASCRERV